jgi:hypothetical protein
MGESYGARMNCIIILNEKVVAEVPEHPWRWTSSTVLFCPHKGQIWARFYLPEVPKEWYGQWLIEYRSSEGTPPRFESEVPGSLLWPYHRGAPAYFPRALIERELLITAALRRKQGVLP